VRLSRGMAWCMGRTAAVVASLAACGGGGGGGEVLELRGPTMGSTYAIKYVPGPEPAVLRAEVERVLGAYDAAFSLWRKDSEIAACNRHPGPDPFPVSLRFRRALELALRTAARTGGAFDPTIQPLSDLYRRIKRGEAAASEAALRAARARVGWRHVTLTAAGVEKARADVELDLDGVVAGLCVDELALRLKELGIAGAMIDVTGEVLCFGERAAGRPWRIGVRRPEAGVLAAETVLELRDRALCTSGSYEDFVEAGGTALHHVLDPRTGANAPNGVVSVSVLARSAALADALSTALMVLGPDAAEPVLAGWPGEDELGALFVLRLADGSLGQRAVRWPAGR
jgi:thiamine biosynthesis lipoprotein